MTPGEAALAWSLRERDALPGGRPSAARIAEYFAPAERGGKLLHMTAGNWCAAGACFALAQVLGSTDFTRMPHGYRVSGLELEQDAQQRGAWLDATSARAGRRPAPGDLAIFNRGQPGDWTRHVGRVVTVAEHDFRTLDANGPGGAWGLVRRGWDSAPLRGFVVYGASPAPGARSGTGDALPFLFMLGAALSLD